MRERQENNTQGRNRERNSLKIEQNLFYFRATNFPSLNSKICEVKWQTNFKLKEKLIKSNLCDNYPH